MNSRIAVLLLALLSAMVWGNSLEDPRFERVSRELGISQHDITYIFQDSRGFLWVATRQGLEKYDGYRFYQYKHEPFDPNSLSGNKISQIVEDRQGRLWLIAGNTLNRFDPRADIFHRYPAQPDRDGGLESKPDVLLCDQSGTLWVGSSQTGLYRYDEATDSFLSYRHDPDDNTTISSDHVVSLYQSRDGMLWVGTINRGFNRLDPETGLFQRYFQEQTAGITFGIRNIPRNLLSPPIVEDNEGNIWVATFGSGLIRLDPQGSRTQFLHNPNDPKTLASNDLWGIHLDSTGSLWLLSIKAGITVLDTNTGLFTRMPDPDRFQISPLENMPVVEDSKGNIWFGLQGDQGLAVYDRELGQFRYYQSHPELARSLAGNDLTFLCFDRSDTLWIGTRTNGLHKYSMHLEKFGRGTLDSGAQKILGQGTVSALMEDSRKTVWLGLQDEGLIRVDGNGALVDRWNQSTKSSLPGNRVTALLEDQAGRVWVGSDKGLSRIDPSGDITTYQSRYDRRGLVSNKIHTLALDDRQRVWVGTGMGGLHLIDLERKIFRPYNLEGAWDNSGPDIISAVGEADEEHLWVGHQGVGLHLLNISNGETTTYSPDMEDMESLSHVQVTSVLRDRHGFIWVGTLMGGLNRMEPTGGTFRNFTQNGSDIPGNNIYGLIEDTNGHIWINMDNGLAVLDPEDETFRAYDTQDGLLINPLGVNAFFRSGDDRLFYGGQGGFNVFRPGDTRINPHEPAIAVTGIRIMDQTQEGLLENGDLLSLDPDSNHFSLDFAALDFTYPAKNQYAYKLIGLDPDWITTNQPTASYPDLDAGNYIFRIKASNNDSVWNLDGLTFMVQVIPPFYRSSSFYWTIASILFFLVIAGFYIQRKRHQAQKREALRHLEWRRKAEELEFARKIQLSMLPQGNLNIDPLEIQCRMRTATEVGGDYYDFFDLDDGRRCLLVGDATGHGLAAGLVVGMVKMAATVWFSGKRFSLTGMHDVLNMGLKQSLRERSMGMALCAVLLDPQTGQVEMASSGMPFPYHFRAEDGSLTALVMKGPPLGFFRKLPIQTKAITLERGDYLIFLSDGLQDRFNKNDELWGLPALERTLQRACRFRFTSERVAEELFDACDIFADGRGNDDDMTVVVIHMTENHDSGEES